MPPHAPAMPPLLCHPHAKGTARRPSVRLRKIPLQMGIEIPLQMGIEIPLQMGIEIPLQMGIEIPLPQPRPLERPGRAAA